MLVYVVCFISLHWCLGNEIFNNVSCLTQPLPCVQAATAQPGHKCVQDSDCPAGVRCCYVGCVRTCELIDPCKQVVCKPGYLCQARHVPCQKQPCRTEATCLPEGRQINYVRCPVLNCPIELCPVGQERVNDGIGCPTCKCKPKKKPENPCTNKKCPMDQECRLTSQFSCRSRAICVIKLRPKYDNTCCLKDKTTLGKSILQSDQVTELDCYNGRCPGGAVCTSFGASTHRCCWQYSQEQIWIDSKSGECPPGINVINASNNAPKSCAFDDQCPGDLKCCYGHEQSLQTQQSGICVAPAPNVSLLKFIQCHGNSVISSIFNMMGLC